MNISSALLNCTTQYILYAAEAALETLDRSVVPGMSHNGALPGRQSDPSLPQRIL